MSDNLARLTAMRTYEVKFRAGASQHIQADKYESGANDYDFRADGGRTVLTVPRELVAYIKDITVD